MAKTQAVWAIDIGQAALKALKLVPGDSFGKVVAEAFDYIEYPKILSQPDADSEELVREAMTTFLERNDLKGCKVAIGVSGQAGLVKFIKLPPVEKKRIPDIVKFEARQQIPFALEEVIWDYQQIGGGDEEGGDDSGFTMAEVGLFAMKRDQIHRAIQPCKNAGIEVDIVQMGPIALYNYAAFDRVAAGEELKTGEVEAGDKPKKAKPEDKGSVVLLDIGADNTDLIITDGTRIWQRNVPIGGNHFTRALTKELKLTFAKAEHLKRNATKAPDPRAVFTAMRGVFNDFSSEVSRSIGFYSSVNRTAKISKVVGLGNGFKLPGLQKFLQQNLSFEVEKLESFGRLSGDEVLGAPQFQENLMSFAVAYGLAVQGLGKGPLKTNLLPPEIEQVRMVRRKKPWALATAALLLLGFSVLFFSDWNAWAKVKSTAFEKATAEAKSASDQASKYEADWSAAVEEFNTKKTQGEQLVGTAAEGVNWPWLFKTIGEQLPNPAQEMKLNPANPKDVRLLSQLRVHLDGIMPVYREDLSTWFNELDPEFKKSMHKLDRDTPPEGAGWVIQIVGHHYNPPRIGRDVSEEIKPLAEGPTGYLQKQVLQRLLNPRFRLLGFTHPVIAAIEVDPKWTTEKGAAAPPMPPMPLLARASAPVGTEGGMEGSETGMPEGYGNPMMAMGGRGMMMPGMGGPEGAGGYGYGSEGMPEGYGNPMMSMGGRGMMMPGMGGPQGKAAVKYKEDTLTRTNFKIDLVWKPVAPADLPQTPEERKQAEAEIMQKLTEATKDIKGALQPLDDTLVSKASQEFMKKRLLQTVAQEKAKAAGPAAKTKGAATTKAAVPTLGPGAATAPAAPKGAVPTLGPGAATPKSP